MSASLYLVTIEAESSIKQKVRDFMGDMYPTDVAIRFGKDGYDLAFLVKKPEYLDALLEDAKLTYELNYTAEVKKVEGSEFMSAIKEIAEYFGEEEDEFLEFFVR